MLKLKDNVDLKELEKFGFVRTSPYWYELPRFSDNLASVMFQKLDLVCWQLLVDAGNVNYRTNAVTKRLDIVFDLIQAGLVEKVE